MKAIVRDLDRLLRGRFSERGGEPSSIPLAHLVQAALVLGVTYGLFMGLYAALRLESPTLWQVAVSAVKVPLLFLLTLLVTFPSLYVFSALGDSPLRGADTLRLLLAAVTVNLALLASFGPITGFFTLSTDSYPFMVVLNTAFFAISGFVGLGFLRRALSGLFERSAEAELTAAFEAAADDDAAEEDAAAIQTDDDPTDDPPHDTANHTGESESESHIDVVPGNRAVRRMALESTRARVISRVASSQRVFRVWIVIYAVVGAQMAWILRPFIGTPSREFALFRPRSSNFFEGLWHSLQALFG